MNFSIYGLHAIAALLKTQPELIEQLYVVSGRSDVRLQSLLDLAQSKSIAIKKIGRKEFESIADKNAVHQGIIAQCKKYTGLNEVGLDFLLDETEKPLLLALDGVQDPHNLGAILRSANAFGVDAVIAPKDRAVDLTPVVHKVASGAASITPFVRVTNLATTLKKLKDRGVWIVGMDERAEQTLNQVDLNGSIAIVLGNEGQGMRKLTRSHCDFFAKIHLLGEIQSLNVSVVAACSLYEANRQR